MCIEHCIAIISVLDICCVMCNDCFLMNLSFLDNTFLHDDNVAQVMAMNVIFMHG